jgi:hypothetical protein
MDARNAEEPAMKDGHSLDRPKETGRAYDGDETALIGLVILLSAVMLVLAIAQLTLR